MYLSRLVRISISVSGCKAGLNLRGGQGAVRADWLLQREIHTADTLMPTFLQGFILQDQHYCDHIFWLL